MSTRREFLIEATSGLCVAFVPGVAGCPGAPRQTPFRGVLAGEQRVVDGVALCWCPPGRFRMGSPLEETGHRADEAQVEVTLTRGFWMAKHEVTQSEWIRIAGDFPDRPPSAEFGEGDDFPAYWINFADAERFCEALTERARRSGAMPAGWEFRLPTEAQWVPRLVSYEAARGDRPRPERSSGRPQPGRIVLARPPGRRLERPG